jgi:hypothetical protein
MYASNMGPQPSTDQWDEIRRDERETQAAEAVRDTLADADGEVAVWLKAELALLRPLQAKDAKYRTIRKALDDAESAILRAWPSRSAEHRTPELMIQAATDALAALTEAAGDDKLRVRAVAVFAKHFAPAADAAIIKSRAEYNEAYTRLIGRELG